jgi:hypothetical protein
MSFFLTSCYTISQKPDYDFINQIKQQAALDSTLKTTIELNPSKMFFGRKINSENINGFFYIKNNGSQNFNLLTIKANCDCIETDYSGKTIFPDDSLKVSYQLNLKNKKGFISNSIVAIGNCQFGNQTFLIEGTIINN